MPFTCIARNKALEKKAELKAFDDNARYAQIVHFNNPNGCRNTPPAVRIFLPLCSLLPFCAALKPVVFTTQKKNTRIACAGTAAWAGRGQK